MSGLNITEERVHKPEDKQKKISRMKSSALITLLTNAKLLAWLKNNVIQHKRKIEQI